MSESPHDARIMALAQLLAPHQERYNRIDAAWVRKRVIEERLAELNSAWDEADEIIRAETIALYDNLVSDLIKGRVG